MDLISKKALKQDLIWAGEKGVWSYSTLNRCVTSKGGRIFLDGAAVFQTDLMKFGVYSLRDS
jgi:hypothetical protein